MTDMEMDLILANAEIASLKDTVRRQKDMIANLNNHVDVLQKIIKDLRIQLENGDGNG